MGHTTTLIRRRNAVAIATGTINVVIGLAVLLGYALRNPSLVTLVPGSAPMRLTTAVAVLCCGIAVLLLAASALRAAAALGALCGLIGLAKLVEVIAGVHIAGFDPVAFAGGAAPRAGTLIGILLLLAATALVLMSGVVRPRARLAIVGFCGSVLNSVGVVALLSYAAGVSSAFTDGAYSQLAIHTSLGMAALGAALIRFAWRDSTLSLVGAPAWTPLLVGAGTLSTVFCLYGALVADQNSDFAHQVAFDAEGLRQFLDAGLENRVQPLIRMARRRAVVSDLKKEEWDADAQMILSRGGYQAIEWVDPSGRAVWATPPGAGDATPDGNAIFEARRRAAFDTARQTRELTASRSVDLVTGGKGTIIVVPVFAKGELAGYVAGVFRYQLLFQNLLAANPSPRYAIAVDDRGDPVFTQGAPSSSVNLLRRMNLAAGAIEWRLSVAPTEALVAQARSPIGGALLVVGAFLSLLFAMLVYLVQRSGARNLMETVNAGQDLSSTAVSDEAGLPVLSYDAEGMPHAWNEIAGRVFVSTPPSITAAPLGFRTVRATVLWCAVPAGNLEGLRRLLDSCTQSALLFDADGRFIAANQSAERMLGWTDQTWAGREARPAASAGNGALRIQTVTIMQGRWSVAAPASASGVQ